MNWFASLPHGCFGHVLDNFSVPKERTRAPCEPPQNIAHPNTSNFPSSQLIVTSWAWLILALTEE